MKERMKGLILGAALTATAFGLTFTAAADRTIRVDDDDIGVKINKAVFTIRDTSGIKVQPFVYKGTTYVPMRAFCEALGLEVDYDKDTNTALITWDDADDTYISEESAKKTAANRAGAEVSDVKRCVLEWDDGRAVYDVELVRGNKKYEYKIDAVTGKILDEDIDSRYDDDDRNPDAKLISLDAAKKAALKDAGVSAANARGMKCDLDRDDLVYEIEFRSGGVEYEYDIDAVTGKILQKETDGKDVDDDRYDDDDDRYDD